MERERLTRLIQRWSKGDKEAEHLLFEQIIPKLKLIFRRKNWLYHTQTTAMVHDFYSYMNKEIKGLQFKNHKSFYSLVGKAVHNFLVNRIRYHAVRKRGGGCQFIHGVDELAEKTDHPDKMLSIHQAMAALAKEDAYLAALIEAKYFGGCTLQEIADSLNKSLSKVSREIKFAEAWLRDYMDD